MEVVLKTLGDHDLGVPRSLQLFCDGDRYLFNCGENCNRFHLEHKLHLARTKYIFLTSLSVETVGGLLGCLLSLNMANVPEICVVGPKYTDKLIRKMLRHVAQTLTIKINIQVLEDQRDYQLTPDVCLWAIPLTAAYASSVREEVEKREAQNGVEPTFFQRQHSCDGETICEDEPVEEGDMLIPKKKMSLSDLWYDEAIIDLQGRDQKYSILYYLQILPKIGKFDPEAAELLKIPKGKLYGQLKAGLSVCLEDGTTIHPHQVCGETEKSLSVIIFEYIADYFPLFLLAKLNVFHPEFTSSRYFFHLSSSSITYLSSYQLFIKFFSFFADTEHIFCDGSDEALSLFPFSHATYLHANLASLLPPLFPCNLLRDSKRSEEDKRIVIYPNKNIKWPSPLTDFILSPSKKVGMETQNCLKAATLPTETFFTEMQTLYPHTAALQKELLQALDAQCKTTSIFSSSLCFSSSFDFSLSSLSEHLLSSLPSPSSFLPFICFIGTGASMPSQYRNVTGILLSLAPQMGIILDFGEGSLSQLYYMSPTWEIFCQIIFSINIIFISHCHADHHLGLLSLLKLKANLFPDYTPPTILGPSNLKEWLAAFNRDCDRIPYTYVSIHNAIKGGRLNIHVREELETQEFSIDLFQVKHVKQSYGIKIETPSVGTVVYSGDSRPCETLLKQASNCTILIHEATFEGQSSELAVAKGHSTIEEVFEIADKANCEFLICTHFSQRYPKVPAQYVPSKHISSEKETNTEVQSLEALSYEHIQKKTIYAFDCMCLPLPIPPLLPQFYQKIPPIIESFFSQKD